VSQATRGLAVLLPVDPVSEDAEQCGLVYGRLVCDLPRGHRGMHRGYDATIDDAIFWKESENMSRRKDPASEVIEYFTTAPLDVVTAMLGVVKGIVTRRLKATPPPVKTDEAHNGKP